MLNAINLLRDLTMASIIRVHFPHIIVRWLIINNVKTAVIISVNFNVLYNAFHLNSTVSGESLFISGFVISWYGVSLKSHTDTQVNALKPSG
jgi:hypothetical protein